MNDIYTVYDDEGKPDRGIESVLLGGIEVALGDARKFRLQKDVLSHRLPLSKTQWAALAPFIAAQMFRTPRFFQSMRDSLDADGIAYEGDTGQRVIIVLIERWITRPARMRGIIAYAETDLPLLTSDNPAAMWKKRGEGFGYADLCQLPR